MAEKHYIMDMRCQKMGDDGPQNVCVVYQGPSWIKALLLDLFVQPLPLKKFAVLQGDKAIFDKVLEYSTNDWIYMTTAAQRDIAKILFEYSENTRSLEVNTKIERSFSRVDSDKMQVLLTACPVSLDLIELADPQ